MLLHMDVLILNLHLITPISRLLINQETFYYGKKQELLDSRVQEKAQLMRLQ